jgi:5-methylcytosine-specific restriction endonuclease McrA
MEKKHKSITDLIIEYFKKHPNEELPHGPVVDWVEEQYKKLYNKKPRDTWRAIRMLHQQGFLIKVKKGIYKYDPNFVIKKEIEDFTPELKEQILKRDGYKCIICGRSSKEGYELHVDHILPKDKGGKATLENGQTLCSICNFRKKNYNQTESGKKMFIRLYFFPSLDSYYSQIS